MIDANTLSNAGTSAREEMNTARAAQYSWRRDTGPTRANASAKVTACPGVTGIPAAPSRRLSATATPGRSRWTVSSLNVASPKLSSHPNLPRTKSLPA